MPYIVIRDVKSNELRVCRIAKGYVPPPDPAYTWGGPFHTAPQAMRAVEAKSEELRKQLYPETGP